MTEILDLFREKLIHGLYVCLIVAIIILACTAAWRLAIYYLTRSRMDLARQIYNAIRLSEPKEKALGLFYEYPGSQDLYLEEALLSGGRHEIVLCLLFRFPRGETGEIRLTYVDNRLIQKQQSGIW